MSQMGRRAWREFEDRRGDLDARRGMSVQNVRPFDRYQLNTRLCYQSQLNLQTTHLSSRLSYFTFLEQAQRMLNNPGDELVLSDGFLGMVERLDSCLTYLKTHVRGR
jgi:hypothetical protein